MAIEINIDWGCVKTYRWFCQECREYVNLKEKEVTSRKNENGIAKEVLKCPKCGKEKML